MKGLQFEFVITESANSFFLQTYLCFEAGTVPRTFNTRLDRVGTFFMFMKTRVF